MSDSDEKAVPQISVEEAREMDRFARSVFSAIAIGNRMTQLSSSSKGMSLEERLRIMAEYEPPGEGRSGR